MIAARPDARLDEKILLGQIKLTIDYFDTPASKGKPIGCRKASWINVWRDADTRDHNFLGRLARRRSSCRALGDAVLGSASDARQYRGLAGQQAVGAPCGGLSRDRLHGRRADHTKPAQHPRIADYLASSIVTCRGSRVTGDH